MEEGDIIQQVLTVPNLRNDFDPRWLPQVGEHDSAWDGTIILRLGNRDHQFQVEAKQEVRRHMLHRLEGKLQHAEDRLLIAGKLTPAIREHLHKEGCNYLEMNGNCSIRAGLSYVYIDGRAGLPANKAKRQRAFSKVGLRVMFLYLHDPSTINRRMADVAHQSGASIPSVFQITKSMISAGYLVETTPDKYVIKDRDQLLQRWAEAYAERLKPSLAKGRYRFMSEAARIDWSSIPLNIPNTCWGGEAAGALLTNYLRPSILTLYTSESRQELTSKYGLVPAENGDVHIYERFWKDLGENRLNALCCPNILAYADLINTGDSRCMETAQLLFDEHIKPTL